MAERSITYQFRGDFRSLTAGLSAASRGVRDFGNDLTGLDQRGEKMRRGLDQVSGTAGKFGLAAAGGFAAAVTASANFEQRMSFVQAATRETAANMDRLEKAALKAGQETAYSATEAAGAIEELAKAGISTADILDGGLSGALDLAAAGGIEVAKAAEVAASAMTQFQLSGDQVPHIADLLAAGAGKAQGSVDDLAAALNQSGLVAAQSGLSIEETTGTLAAFASAGLLGSDAGTSFKTMLQSLTPTSNEAQKAMDAMGFSAYDANGNFIGMVEVARKLRAGLSEMSVEQQNATLKTIFGSDAVRAASVIFQQGAGGIQEWIDKTNDAGYASEIAGIRMDNLKGDLEGLKGALETALIGTGEGSSGALRGLTNTATDLVNVFNLLPGPVKASTGALLGITAVLGGGLWFGAKAIQGVVTTRQALADLGVQAPRTAGALGKIGRAAAPIGAVTTSLMLLNDALSQSAEIDAGDLTRDLEAFANGKMTDSVDKFVAALAPDRSSGGNGWGYAFKSMSQDLTSAMGLIGDASWEVAAKNVDAIDKALAQMVESGRQAEAENIFQMLRDQLGEGVSLDYLNEQLDSYNTALDNSANAAEGQAAATKKTGDAAAGAVPPIEDLTEATEKAAQAALGAFDAETAWRQALNEAREAAGKNSAGIRGNSKEALENREVLSQLAGAWQNQSEAVRNSEGRLRAARKAFIDAATSMGVPIAQAKRLADSLIGIPSKKSVNVDVTGLGSAISGVDQLKRELAGVQSKTVTITVHGKKTGASVGTPGGLDQLLGGSADGSTVPKDGRPYADRYLYMLAPGEEVISNRYGQADRHRELLKAINSNRLANGGTVGLADGGTARRLPGLAFADLPAINLATASLKGLNRALRQSENALDKEREQRDRVRDAMVSLRSDVTTGLRSDLFGEQSGNVWSMANRAGSFNSILATLAADTRAGKACKADVAALKKKGLDGGALKELLSSGSPEQVAMFADLSRSQLARFEAAFERRQQVTASAGQAAGSAVYGKALKIDERQVGRLEHRLHAIEKRIGEEHREDRKHSKRGAGNGSRNRRRG